MHPPRILHTDIQIKALQLLNENELSRRITASLISYLRFFFSPFSRSSLPSPPSSSFAVLYRSFSFRAKKYTRTYTKMLSTKRVRADCRRMRSGHVVGKILRNLARRSSSAAHAITYVLIFAPHARLTAPNAEEIVPNESVKIHRTYDKTVPRTRNLNDRTLAASTRDRI